MCMALIACLPSARCRHVRALRVRVRNVFVAWGGRAGGEQPRSHCRAAAALLLPPCCCRRAAAALLLLLLARVLGHPSSVCLCRTYPKSTRPLTNVIPSLSLPLSLSLSLSLSLFLRLSGCLSVAVSLSPSLPNETGWHTYTVRRACIIICVIICIIDRSHRHDVGTPNRPANAS